MTRSSSNEISATEAAQLISAAFTIKDYGYFVDTIHDTFPDARLEVTTARTLVNIARSIPKTRFVADENDCDDFARIFYCKSKSHNAKMAISSLAIFDSTWKIRSPHAMCVSIIRYHGKNKVVVVEPQRVGRVTAHLLRWPRKEDEARIICF